MKALKNIIKWLLLIVAMVIVLLIGLWAFNGPQDLAENSQSKMRLDQAAYDVDTMRLEVIDDTRKTPALGDFDGDDKRTLHGSIWFPKGVTSRQPLIVFSHGFGGHHKDSRYLIKYLAENGYVVAAVDFPLSNARSPAGVPQMVDVVNQPGDVTAVISHLMAMNTDPKSVLHNRIDGSNVGAMGLSLGGLTTALASFHPDLKDQRISAAIMMAPPLESFTEQFFATHSAVKSLVVSGSHDRVVPESLNATQVQTRHPQGWFISFDKGTHLGFANIGNPVRWMHNPDDFGCVLMEQMLPKLDLPERWDFVIPNTNNILREKAASQPCPELSGKAMNGVRQQWLTQLTIGAFFDMHLRSGSAAETAYRFFTQTLVSENPEVTLTLPR